MQLCTVIWLDHAVYILNLILFILEVKLNVCKTLLTDLQNHPKCGKAQSIQVLSSLTHNKDSAYLTFVKIV